MHKPVAAPVPLQAALNPPTWRMPRRLALRRVFSIPRLTVALVAIGLSWRLFRYLVFMPIWGDEAFVAINFIRRDFGGMIEPLLWGQIVPLGFMWAELAISRVAGLSEYALRLLPNVAAIAAMILFWRFSVRTLPRRAAMLSVGLFAASYFIVRHGAEVKPYSLDLLVALVLTMLARRVLDRPDAIGAWAALTAAAAIGVWCSYPAVFVAGGAGVALARHALARRGAPRTWTAVLAYAVIVGLSSAAMVWLIARPHAAAASALVETNLWARTFPPLDRPWRLPLWFAAIHTGSMFAYPQGGNAPGSIATFALFVMGCLSLRRTNRDMLWLWLTPFALNLAAAAMKSYPYGGAARICQHFAPAICWLAGLGAARVLHALRSRVRVDDALAVCAGILSIIPMCGMAGQAIWPQQSPGSRRSYDAVRALAAQTGAADRWVVFNSDQPVDYAPYWGDWRGIGGQFVFDVARMSPVPVEWGPRPESISPPPGGSVWLMNYRIAGQKVEFPEDQWQTYLVSVTTRLGQPWTESFLIQEKSRRQSQPSEPGVEAAGSAAGSAPSPSGATGAERALKLKTEVLEVYRFGPTSAAAVPR